MKPRNIFLVRHGESEGNTDSSTYALKPDHMLLLTDSGRRQAANAGRTLAAALPSDESVVFYISPLWRSRMTYELIAKEFVSRRVSLREDPRIREQEWGHLKDSDRLLAIDAQRDRFGKFYYRIEGGESCADVYDRVSDFITSLHRDFTKSDYPANAIIVTHGTTIRLFLMKWFHWVVEDFEELANPENGDIVRLALDAASDKFVLKTELRRKELPTHLKYQWGQW